MQPNILFEFLMSEKELNQVQELFRQASDNCLNLKKPDVNQFLVLLVISEKNQRLRLISSQLNQGLLLEDFTFYHKVFTLQFGKQLYSFIYCKLVMSAWHLQKILQGLGIYINIIFIHEDLSEEIFFSLIVCVDIFFNYFGKLKQSCVTIQVFKCQFFITQFFKYNFGRFNEVYFEGI